MTGISVGGWGDSWIGETAHAQTDQRVNVAILKSDATTDTMLQAMRIAAEHVNLDYPAGQGVTLYEIEVSDYSNRTLLAAKIQGALRAGVDHFVGPVDPVPLAHTLGTISRISPDSIIISPSSATTGRDFYYADDNLFRLVPNHNTVSAQLANLFDRHGTDKLIYVTDSARASYGVQPPDDLHSHFSESVMPVILYDERIPGNAAKNLESAMELDRRLGDLIDRYGQDKVGAFFPTDPVYYRTLVKILLDNPQLENPGKVRWYAPQLLVGSPVLNDPGIARFSEGVRLTANLYEVLTRDAHSALLDRLDTYIIPHDRTAIFAAYDAVHLLADSSVLASANSGLSPKEAVYTVVGGEHPVEHTMQILREWALGDFSLDRNTGDLIANAEDYIEHRFEKRDGSYGWFEIFPSPPPRTCR